jgi:hypothetical protein
LFFLHIMKTAGTAVHQTLSLRFPEGGFLNGVHHLGIRDQDPNDYSFVRGLVDFGYVSRYRQRPTILTILREPLERSLSAYSYFASWSDEQCERNRKRFPADVAETRIRFRNQARNKGLGGLIADDPELAQQFLSNVQTRSLLGGPIRILPAELSQDQFREAQANLESCELVGLCERLDDTMRLVERHFGWADLTPLPRLNVTSRRVRVADLDSKTLATLREWNRLDSALHECAGQRLEREMQQMSAEVSPDRPPSSLPNAAAFSLEQPLSGHGWHARERCGDTLILWSHSDQEAWLTLNVPPESATWFHARIARAVHPSALKGLRVWINDVELHLSRRRAGKATQLDAPIPGAARSTGRVRVRFRTPEALRPCDVTSGNQDDRYLGIALESLCLDRSPPAPAPLVGQVLRDLARPVRKVVSALIGRPSGLKQQKVVR